MTTFAVALALVYGGYNLGAAVLGAGRGLDFAQYYVAARLVMAGEPATMYDQGELYQSRAASFGVQPIRRDDGVFEVMTYVYPPLVAYLFVPLATLPYSIARLLFSVANLLAVFAAVPLIVAARAGTRRQVMTAVGLLAVAVFYPNYFVVGLGQIGGVLFLLCALTLFFARRRQDWLAALCLALAINVKVFPAVLLPWLAAKRQYRAVLLSLLFTVALALIPAILGGSGLISLFFGRALPGAYSGGAYYRNQGFAGFFSRLLTNNEYVAPLVNQPELARILTAIAGATVLLVTIVLCLRKAPPGSRLYEFQFAACLIAALLFLDKSYETYAAMLLPAFLLAFEEYGLEQNDGRLRLTLVCVCFCIWAFVLNRELEYRKLPTSMVANLAFSAKFLATFVLWILYAGLLGRSRTPQPDPPLLTAGARP